MRAYALLAHNDLNEETEEADTGSERERSRETIA